jgi:hypothetical protein
MAVDFQKPLYHFVGQFAPCGVFYPLQNDDAA